MQSNNPKDGKVKFSVNVIDILIILFAVVCVVGLVLRAVNFSLPEPEEELERHKITFSVSGVSSASEKYFKIGDTVTLSDSGVKLGTISKKDSVKASTAYVKNAAGETVAVEYPENTKIDVVCTANSEGLKDSDGYSLRDGKYIVPGESYRVRTEHMDFVLTVLEIE